MGRVRDSTRARRVSISPDSNVFLGKDLCSETCVAWDEFAPENWDLTLNSQLRHRLHPEVDRPLCSPRAGFATLSGFVRLVGLC